MKNFNWELFRKGEFAVCCKTVEEELDFLQECEDRGFEWCSGSKPTQLTYLEDEGFKAIYFDSTFGDLTYSSNEDVGIDVIKQSIRWKIEPKTTTTWREVFANIQEGEEYSCGTYFITLKDGKLGIGKEGCKMCFGKEHKFTKKEQPKPVDFKQALVALQEGKTVESDLNGFHYKLQNETLRRSFGGDYWETADLTYNEITDKWYIID